MDLKESQNQRGPRGSERCHGVATLCLGLLSVFLLVGLISLGVHYHHSAQRSAAELSMIKDNHLQVKDNLTEMTKELERLQSLSKLVKTCPAGWQMFCCSCYLLSNESGTWDKGREDCRNRGADLVVIDGHKEEMFLSKFTRTNAWIGLNDREKEGTWKWVDGSPLTLTYWETHQPDNGGGDPQWGEEDCIHIRPSSSGYGEWNDRSCNVPMRWICEKIA